MPAGTGGRAATLQRGGATDRPAGPDARAAALGRGGVTDKPAGADAPTAGLQRGGTADRPMVTGARSALQGDRARDGRAPGYTRGALCGRGVADGPSAGAHPWTDLRGGRVADSPAATDARAGLRGRGVTDGPAGADARSVALQLGGAESGSSWGMGGDLKVHKDKHAFGPFGIDSCSSNAVNLGSGTSAELYLPRVVFWGAPRPAGRRRANGMGARAAVLVISQVRSPGRRRSPTR